MKRFIIYVLLFFGCFLFSDLLLIYVTKKSFDEQLFKLPSNKHVLILGDSHLECALDDSILSNTVNLCHSGEAYIYTYVKMKLFLAANPQIKTVWLSFNLHSLSEEADGWLYNREGIQNIDRYVYFFDSEEKVIFLKNIRYYLSIMRLPYNYRDLLINKVCGKDNNYNNLRWGGYLHFDKNNLQSEKIRVYDTNINRFSSQYRYLYKIVEYCSSNNINLTLINSPIKNTTDFDATSYLQFINKLKRKYTNTNYLDYTDFPLPDSCYADVEHLNYKGAEIFSKYLNRKLF